MMTPVVSSTHNSIYAIGEPISPVNSPIIGIVYTEEDLEDFVEPYWTIKRKVLCGVFVVVLSATMFFVFKPLFF